MSDIKKIFIAPNLSLDGAVDCTKDVVEKLIELDFVPMLCVDDAEKIDGINRKTEIGTLDNLLSDCDAVIAIGGDGTIFHKANDAMKYDKPLLGINSGRLGFLSQLEANDISALKKLKSGEYVIESRVVIRIDVYSDAGKCSYYAINDVVFYRAYDGRIIDIEVDCEGDTVGNYRADGLIFATPIGSTAYSLSAGGPIVDPTMDSIIMTPVCPHSLYGRSVVFPSHKQLRVRTSLPDTGAGLSISVDGVNICDVDKIKYVTVNKAEITSKFICLGNRSFYKTLNQKLKLRG